jgi:hypothetical protein
LAGTVVVETDVVVELGVDVDAPLLGFEVVVDVVVAFTAAAVDVVVVPELDFAGDGEEQPARMPAAPSTPRTRNARPRVILVDVPLVVIGIALRLTEPSLSSRGCHSSTRRPCRTP